MRRLSPEEQREARRARASPAPVKRLSSKARAAIVEKRLARYVLLDCEHYTTREDIELNSYWQEKKGFYYCRKCDSWNPEKPKPKAEDLPWDPPF